MFKFIRILGDSLYPDYQEGDFVLISKIPFYLNWIRPGDVVVFNHPRYGKMIKRVLYVNPTKQEYFVIGNGNHSVDSRRFGPLGANAFVGKVLYHHNPRKR